MCTNISIINSLNEYPLRATSSSEREINPEDRKLRKRIDKLLILVKDSIESEEEFSISAYKIFDEVFELRLNILQFLSKEGISIREINDYILEDFAKKKIKENHEQLFNIVFSAIETLKRVSNAFVERENNSMMSFDLSEGDSIPDFSYDDYRKFLKITYSSLPPKFSKYIIDLFDSSLILETSIFAADILFDNNLKLNISPKRIKELENLISKNTLIYFSSAVGLGMFSNEKSEKLNDSKSAEFKKERRKSLDFLAKQAQDLKLGYQ